MKETGHISKSQYSGTLKNSTCLKCGKSLNNKSRLEQDQHKEQCSKQTKLFDDK